MSIRIKNQWFKTDSSKTVTQTASVLASIVWRVAQNMIKQLRQADFDIRVGTMYFDVTREMLVFLLQQVDRMAFSHFDESQRIEFTTYLVTRVAEILQENETEWLSADDSATTTSWANQFIELYNQRMDDYACFEHDPDGANFQLSRYFANRLESILDSKDSHWIADQMIAIEVPQAQALMKKGFDGLLSPASPKRSRASVSGD
jgi:hypothetical protein